MTVAESMIGITEIALELIRTDGETQPRVTQNWDVISEYAQAMRDGAIFKPVVLFYDEVDYWLADGFHRYHASKQAGLDVISADIRNGSQEEAIEFSCGANAEHGLRRTNEDKRHCVTRLLRISKWRDRSDREVAKQCGVSHTMVASVRALCSLANFASEHNAANGPQIREYTTRYGTTATMNTSSIFRQVDFHKTPEPVEKVLNRDGVPLAVPHILSKNTEWYTPSKYIESARRLMGGVIELDPASCALADATVKANKYYDIEIDGLSKDWPGRVWLNPPYGYTNGESNQAIWSGRLIDQYRNKITTEAVLLVNAAVDTKWFQRLFEYPVCLTLGRINFSAPDPTVSGSTHGSAFVYFGANVQGFIEIFSEFGTVVKRW